MPNKGHYPAWKQTEQGGLMDETKGEIEVLPAKAGPAGDGHELVVHADLERLRRAVTAPEIVKDGDPIVG
jgi:hypothetical protein